MEPLEVTPEDLRRVELLRASIEQPLTNQEDQQDEIADPFSITETTEDTPDEEEDFSLNTDSIEEIEYHPVEEEEDEYRFEREETQLEAEAYVEEQEEEQNPLEVLNEIYENFTYELNWWKNPDVYIPIIDKFNIHAAKWDVLCNVLEQFYPNKYDIQFNQKGVFNTATFYLNIYLYYDVITISNSTGYSRNLTDFFVLLELKFSTSYFAFKGTRASYDALEIDKTYTHSHLHSNLGYFSPFCKGNGTLATIIKTFNIYDITDTNTRAFFLAIDQYLTHESLAGGPYHRLEDLKFDSVLYTNNLSIPYYTKRLSQCKNVNVTFCLYYVYNNIKLTYTQNEGFVVSNYEKVFDQLLHFIRKEHKDLNSKPHVDKIQDIRYEFFKSSNKDYFVYSNPTLQEKIKNIEDNEKEICSFRTFSVKLRYVKKPEYDMDNSITGINLNFQRAIKELINERIKQQQRRDYYRKQLSSKSPYILKNSIQNYSCMLPVEQQGMVR